MSNATVVSRYDDARDEIIEPHHHVQLTHYYVDKWLPELGERGNVIVTVLKRMGYLNRKTNKERNGVEIEQSELAALCGLTLRTFQREFGNDDKGQPVNPALHHFVQREKQYTQNSAGKIIREKTVYIVAMRDPIHPSDTDALQKERERREKGRSRQDGAHGNGPNRQDGGDGNESGGGPRQDGVSSRHLGGKYNVDSDSESPLNTLDTPAAHGVLPSALGEKEESSLAAARRNRADDFAFIDKLRKGRR